MLVIALFGLLIVVATVAIHAGGSLLWATRVWDRFTDAEGLLRPGSYAQVLIGTLLVLLLLHALEIALWAGAYLLVLPSGELASLEEAVYFSIVTYTTLGYGDITLSPGWRLLSGTEALNGILLAGWSTAFLFGAMQRTWQSMASRRVSGNEAD